MGTLYGMIRVGKVEGIIQIISMLSIIGEGCVRSLRGAGFFTPVKKLYTSLETAPVGCPWAMCGNGVKILYTIGFPPKHGTLSICMLA
jgi:hypothetical protein